jgi:DNA-binding transcriptional regulator YhcF (GntR family)
MKSEWVKALADHILQRDEEEIPPGWLSTKQIAKLFKRTPTTTSRIISQMVRAGKAEMKKFKGTICAQRKKHNESLRSGPSQKYLRKTPYFRLISPTTKPTASKSYKHSSR